MIFAHGSNIEEWSWAAVKAIPVLEEEKEKYNNNEYKTDMSTIKHFTERNYLDALSYIGVIPE